MKKILLLFMSASAGLAEFGPVEMTKQDIIDVYSVPVDTQPAEKYVWRLSKPSHLKIVFERQNEDGRWGEVQSNDRQVRDSAYVIVVHPSLLDPDKNGDRFVLRVPWGYKNGEETGWTSFDVAIEHGAVGATLITKQKDPENFMTIMTKAGVYRLRVLDLKE